MIAARTTGVRLVVVIALSLAPLLQACGGSSDRDQIRAAVATYYGALSRRDASAACRELSAAFWQATLREADARLSPSPPLPLHDCRNALGYIFAHATGASVRRLPGVQVTGISIHGNTATATAASGTRRSPVGFVRAGDGNWQINCCTGAQLETQAQATYRVPSISMEPTLKPGQVVTADNAAMRTHSPTQGDIIIFHPPASAGQTATVCSDPRQGGGHEQPCGVPGRSAAADLAIKRVVGLPGDHVAIIGGHVVKNGQLQHEPFTTPCSGPADPCNFPRPIVLPRGTYYVLGDNRGASLDSRFWGPIPREWIVGLIRP